MPSQRNFSKKAPGYGALPGFAVCVNGYVAREKPVGARRGEALIDGGCFCILLTLVSTTHFSCHPHYFCLLPSSFSPFYPLRLFPFVLLCTLRFSVSPLLPFFPASPFLSFITSSIVLQSTIRGGR